MILKYDDLVSYKQTKIDSNGKLTFFLEKHSTKEGSWAKFSLQEGAIDFVCLNGQGLELSRTRINEEAPELLIPPASWHKIIPVSDSFKATLEFCCMPHRYFPKKYALGAVHSDLMYVYQAYLRDIPNLSILDVGCGSGRNLLYLAKMGHRVTGIDQNKKALESIQEIVEKEDLSEVDTLLHDLNQPLEIKPEQYDLVLSTVSLQFLKPQRIPELLTELQTMTKVNGYHCLVFPVQAEPYSLPASFTYMAQKEELYHAYQDSGWSIIEHKESMGHLHRKDEQGRLIAGSFALLLAQKIT
tara:strand:- start:896 stop:1792 length:897 start_codon:yes stop_codon:yes gene_type:complete